MGWVNQRVLRYDALAEHASAEEMQPIFAARRGTLYVLGALLALLAYVPLVGFVAPVLFGLAFIHLLLGELQALRQAPIEGEAVPRYRFFTGRCRPRIAATSFSSAAGRWKPRREASATRRTGQGAGEFDRLHQRVGVARRERGRRQHR